MQLRKTGEIMNKKNLELFGLGEGATKEDLKTA